MHNDITDLIKESHIFLGKLSASCSGIHQASDVSPLFRAAKQKVAYIHNHEVDVSNPTLQRRIESLLAQSSLSSISNVSSECKHKISYECMMILWSLREMARPNNIQRGFKDTGQYPLSFDTIMSRCYTNIDLTKREAMKNTTEADVQFFRAQGHLTEEQLDVSNIETIPSNNSVPRDQRPLQNQRSVLISHPETLARFVAYENRGLDIGNSILETASGKERKEYREARNLIAKL